MKKIIFLILILFIELNAKMISATYKISFGIFGTIGIAKTKLIINKKQTYKILIEARATGLAKILSGGRVEKYQSEGKVIDGLLVPDKYIVTVIKKSKKREKIYLFDHKNKKVKKITIRIKDNKMNKSEEYLKYYAKNDILTLFFNLKHYLLSLKGKENLFAIGANKKNGKINVIIPTGKKLKILQKDLKEKNGHFFIVFINQKIFSSKRGELFLNLNKDGICTKAVLKDVIFFGDIRGKLQKLKVENDNE